MNDQARMTKDFPLLPRPHTRGRGLGERGGGADIPVRHESMYSSARCFVIRHSDFFRHSSLEIRHSPTMPEISWDTFERYRQKGLDARRAGQWDSARIYLLEAARAMVDLSKEAQGDELQSARRETATKLLELAKDCDKAKGENRKSPGAVRAGGSGTKASESQSEAGADA